MTTSVSRPATHSVAEQKTPVVTPDIDEPDANAEIVSGLASYLSKLGGGKANLSKVTSLLEALQGEELSVNRANETAQRTIKLYLAEEQQILREVYRSFFDSQPNIEVLGSSDDVSCDILVEAASTLKPDVMIVGVKTLHGSTVENLETLREPCPDVGLVLFFAFYDANGIKGLREFSRNSSVGCAYLLKHTVDTVDQLTQVIDSVAQGRIMVDPVVMDELISNGGSRGGVLKELSPKALEVLDFLAKSYRNDTIADLLSRDVKTVERHINNIYSALDDYDDSKHPRVRAALMYLKATGALSTEQPFVE